LFAKGAGLVVLDGSAAVPFAGGKFGGVLE
jgi:hypothetical protein